MSFVKIWVHAVWGTKDRQPFLKPPVLQKICDHIKQNATNNDIFIDTINGHDDHIHLLMLLNAGICLSKQMQLLKGESARWANENIASRVKLEWSVKYYACSVSPDKIKTVRSYINNQRNHHTMQTFEEEYKQFLQSIGYD